MRASVVELKSLDIASCVKMSMILYAFIGLVGGGFMALFSLFGSMMGTADSSPEAPFMGAFIGVWAIVVLPILYGVMGAISGAIGALLYNLAAGWVGGISVSLEPDAVSDGPPASRPSSSTME